MTLSAPPPTHKHNLFMGRSLRAKEKDLEKRKTYTVRTLDYLPSASEEYVSHWAIPYWIDLIQRFRVALAIAKDTGFTTGEARIACAKNNTIADALKEDVWFIGSEWGTRIIANKMSSEIPDSTLDDLDTGFMILFPTSSLEPALVAAKAKRRTRRPDQAPPERGR